MCKKYIYLTELITVRIRSRVLLLPLQTVLIVKSFLFIHLHLMIVYNKKILASILFLLIGFVSMAAQREGGPPPPVVNSPPNPPGDGLPIDNGLIILFIVAIIFGVYMTLKLSKKPTQA